MEIGEYLLKEQFFPMLDIPISQYKNRREELLDWLSQFYEYQLTRTSPVRIIITEVYTDTYEPLPRKTSGKVEAAREDYNVFVYNLFSEDKERPVTKIYVSREAMDAFATEKYGHHSDRYVSTHYVKPALEQEGIERMDTTVWVNNQTMDILNDDQLQFWFDALKEYKFDKSEAWVFVSSYFAGDLDEIEDLGSAYKSALNRFVDEYGFYPVKAHQYKIKHKD